MLTALPMLALLITALSRSACEGVVANAKSGMRLPLANVSACGTSVLSDVDGRFSVDCPPPCDVQVWARQYNAASASVPAAGGRVELEPRAIPGFPATDWKFEGWAVEAQSRNVPGTKISFLAHPSAYRPPSGNRTFLTTTANSHAGPGWTQGYWQVDSAVRATAVRGGPLVNGSNPAMRSTAFTGRMLMAGGQLLMLIGMTKTALLENHNLEDPSHPEDWVAAEGDGQLQVDWAGAPTSRHEDYRLHHFEQGYACNGTGKKFQNWLFVIPDGVSASRTGPDPESGTLDPAPPQSPSVVAVAAGTGAGGVLNDTNLRGGNLRQVQLHQASSGACATLCSSDAACYAWVFEAGPDLCFLKNADFCANAPSDACGGCELQNGTCPCSAGIKASVRVRNCTAPGPGPSPAPKAGRACGRMGFVSEKLTGPYRYCQWLELPEPQGLSDPGGPGSNCDSWPGDLIQAKDGSLFFVNGWGNIYRAPPGTLRFDRLPANSTIARPAPQGSWDDLHQIEFTFLPPREAGARWMMYHASYSSVNQNPNATRADYGYKQAIGMYSFTWDA